MKRKIFTFVMGLLILSTVCANAQDVIVKKDNSTILCKVTKISSTEIEYNKWSKLDGPTYIISVSEVVRINYNDDTYDDFQAVNEINHNYPKYGKGVLRVKNGSKLTLDGTKLAQEEIKDLLGDNYYGDYQTGKRFLNAAGTMEVLFILTGIPAFYFIAGGIGDRNASALSTGILFACVSIPCGVLFGVFDGVGNRRINEVVNDYNKHNDYYSLNLSPSVIRCSTPQSQNNYGLGLTLSLNF